MARPPTGQIIEREGIRGRIFGLRFRAYDWALEWARMGISDAVTAEPIPAETTESPV